MFSFKTHSSCHRCPNETQSEPTAQLITDPQCYTNIMGNDCGCTESWWWWNTNRKLLARGFSVLITGQLQGKWCVSYCSMQESHVGCSSGCDSVQVCVCVCECVPMWYTACYKQLHKSIRNQCVWNDVWAVAHCFHVVPLTGGAYECDGDITVLCPLFNVHKQWCRINPKLTSEEKWKYHVLKSIQNLLEEKSECILKN